MILTPYLIVKDMEKSCAFYTAFFGEEPDHYCPGRFVIFDAGNTKLSLYNPEYDHELFQSGADLSENFNEAYIAVRSKPVTYGNNVVLNIAAPYWCFWLTDPDGNCLEITGGYEE